MSVKVSPALGLLSGVKQTQSARKRPWGLNVRCWGYSGRNQHDNRHRPSNVSCWGISGRSGNMAGESACSQEET